MPRSLALTAIILLLLTALVPARAAAPYFALPAFVAQTKDDGDKGDQSPAKNAGSIDGQITNVDYGAGRISVKAGTTRYDVVVLPSTSIQGRATDTFHTIADVHKGAHVQVIMSRRAGSYIAQIIRLL